MWHLVGIFGAVSFLVILTFALGTCLFDKREIQSNIKNATLQQLAAFKKSRLVLFIPHRKAGYIEIELSTNGMTAPRMEELRREIQNALQKYTLVGKFQDGGAGEYDIVKFRVRKGKAKSKDSVLYA